jgi:DNA-binding PadR family transcriptional regulator
MTRENEFFFNLKQGLPHHHGGHHFRGGSFGPGGPPFGGGRGRRRRGIVRIALLMLLAEEPRNGYQLMQAIEERSGGRWRPSPGAVYPALQQLEDEGLIRPIERDGVKLFELTDAGEETLRERREDKPPWAMADDPESVGDLRSQIKQLQVAVMQVATAGSAEQIARAAIALGDARRALYRILAEDDRPADAGGDAGTPEPESPAD